MKSTRKIKCPVCPRMIQIGDYIVFETFRWHGRDQRHPMHAEHDSNFRLTKSKLDILMSRANATGHGSDPSDYWEI